MLDPVKYKGLNILIDDNVTTKTIEDWSNVRSWGRAVRRRKRGFKQNIVFRYEVSQDIFKFGDNLLMHSTMYKKFIAELKKKNEDLSPYLGYGKW